MTAHHVEVLRKIVWRQLEHFRSREIFEKRSDPSEILAEVRMSIRPRPVDDFRQQRAKRGQRLARQRVSRNELDRLWLFRIFTRPLGMEDAQLSGLRFQRLALVRDDGRAREACRDDDVAVRGMEAERKEPAGEGLSVEAHLLVNA